MGVLLLTQLTELMEAIHTSTHDDRSSTANETSDKIIGKIGNKTRQVRTHT
jgi:hypothetical protein